MYVPTLWNMEFPIAMLDMFWDYPTHPGKVESEG